MGENRMASQLEAPASDDVSADASLPFVGRWNRLVSTTNWEKGRIIVEWRESLLQADAPASEYSDETWARCVGGITGQHVGRLRRVYQRFGDSYATYDGLYWSHFHAALEWQDAEMWLEGALQSGWSVSQMRRQRWETLGGDDDPGPDGASVSSEWDEDFEPALNQPPRPEGEGGQGLANAPAERPERAESADRAVGQPSGDTDHSGAEPLPPRTHSAIEETATESIEFVRPFENLAELPDDVADAFEAFKLAILRHKADGWQQISRDDVLSSLDALKTLATAPGDDAPPFHE